MPLKLAGSPFKPSFFKMQGKLCTSKKIHSEQLQSVSKGVSFVVFRVSFASLEIFKRICYNFHRRARIETGITNDEAPVRSGVLTGASRTFRGRAHLGLATQ